MAVVINKLLPEFEAVAPVALKLATIRTLDKPSCCSFTPKTTPLVAPPKRCQFRDKNKDFVKAGAVVFGVSRDNMKSHDSFKALWNCP